MKRRTLLLSFMAAMIYLLGSCKHEPMVALDETLFNESTAAGLSLYRNGDILEGKAPSPHGEFKLKFNDIALAALDQDGKLPVGETFPVGSLIVKEIYKRGKPDIIAIMKKDSTNSHSAEGWLWAEYEQNGDVYHSVSRNGSGCTGCHGGTPNRDLTRVFDLH